MDRLIDTLYATLFDQDKLLKILSFFYIILLPWIISLNLFYVNIPSPDMF